MFVVYDPNKGDIFCIPYVATFLLADCVFTVRRCSSNTKSSEVSLQKNLHYTSFTDPGCLSRIPDQTFSHPGSEFFPSRIRIKIYSKKGVLSSRKYDSDCSFRIRILPFYPFRTRNPYPGVKKAPDPDPQHCIKGIVQPFELGGETRLIRSAVK